MAYGRYVGAHGRYEYMELWWLPEICTVVVHERYEYLELWWLTEIQYLVAH